MGRKKKVFVGIGMSGIGGERDGKEMEIISG